MAVRSLPIEDLDLSWHESLEHAMRGRIEDERQTEHDANPECTFQETTHGGVKRINSRVRHKNDDADSHPSKSGSVRAPYPIADQERSDQRETKDNQVLVPNCDRNPASERANKGAYKPIPGNRQCCTDLRLTDYDTGDGCPIARTYS